MHIMTRILMKSALIVACMAGFDAPARAYERGSPDAAVGAIQSLSSDIYDVSRETDQARILPTAVPAALDARVAALRARLDALRRDTHVDGIDTGALARKLDNVGFLLGNVERARANTALPMQHPLVPDHHPRIAKSTFAHLDTRGGDRCGAAFGLANDGEVAGVLDAGAELWLHVEVAAGSSTRIDTATTPMDTEIAVFETCPAQGGTPLSTNDDAFGLSAAVVLQSGDRHRSFRVRVRNLGARGEVGVVAGAGGAVSGHVDWPHAAGGGAQVVAIDASGFYAGTTYSYSGDYSLSLEPGSYYVVANAYGNVPRIWPNIECGSPFYYDCAHAPAALVAVAASTATNGIDFVLDAGATITGRVRDAVTGLPLAGTSVAIYGDDFPNGWDAWTDSVGRFSITTLAAGDYHAMASSGRYLLQLFDRVDCPLPQTCGAYDGNVIHLSHGQVFAQADFSLHEAPFVRAVIHAPTGGPQNYGYVVAFDSNGAQLWQYAEFDTPAEVGPLAPGTYHFVAHVPTYVSQAYDHIDCASDCLAEVATATPVAVTQGGTEPSVTFDLHAMPVVSGRISDAGSGDGLADAVVTLSESGGLATYSAATAIDGTYAIPGVSAGTYHLVVTSTDHRDTAYVDVPCAESEISTPEPCPFAAAQPISVGAVDVGGIDVALPMNGTISGQFGFAGGGPLGPGLDVGIMLYDAAGNALRIGYPDTTGHYSIDDVAAGTYYAEVIGWSIFGQVYSGVDCPMVGEPCDPTSGTPITISQGEHRPDIDFGAVGARRIQGRLTDASSGLGIPGAIVDAWSVQDGTHCGVASSDLQGDYVLIDDGTCPDASRMLSTDAGAAYVNEVFDDIACPHGSVYAATCTLIGATPVAFPLSPVPARADFLLEPRDPDQVFADGFDVLAARARR